MSIEEQIKSIAKDELAGQLDEVEKRMKATFKRESSQLKSNIMDLAGKIDEVNAQLEDLRLRIEKLEEELNNRWSLVVKLRKYTLDQLMSEYKRLTGQMRPEQ
ncbi:MAG: hypothetical protein JSV18_07120, partial [Candidatus Bathyarchaeota archaeon]